MLALVHATNPPLRLIFETLYPTSTVDVYRVTGLADTWELAEDGVTWTFRLHRVVRWHDGMEFTPEHVAYGYGIQVDPDTGSNDTSRSNDAVVSWRVVDPFSQPSVVLCCRLTARRSWGIFVHIARLGREVVPVA